MRPCAAFVILCFGVALGSPPRPQGAEVVRSPRSPARLQLLAEYERDEQSEEEERSWEGARRRPAPGARLALQAVPVELPLGGRSGVRSGVRSGAGGARGQAVRVLLLPLHIPAAPAPRTECNLRFEEDTYGDNEDYEDVDYAPKPKPRRPAKPRPAARRRPATPVTPAPEPDYEEAPQAAAPRPSPPPARPRPAQRAGADTPRYPAYVHADRLDETAASPRVATAASSAELLEKFRAQAPTAPLLPPVVLSEHDASERAPRPDDHDAAAAPPVPAPSPVAPASTPAPSKTYLPTQTGFGTSFGIGVRGREPSRPRLDRALLLHGELTVPRADYTETYTAWWDAASGAARVDFYGGSTATFRSVLPDGRVQRLEMRVDRSGEGAVRRCGRTAPRPATPADRSPPALPDLQLFSFAGYVTDEGERAERWQHTRSERVGELGAARGEALTFRHELLLRRAPDDSAVPLRYAVSVDSSLLGAACDGYEHRYSAREQPHHPDLFAPNVDDMCDTVEELDDSSAEHVARLEPLREFTLPHRDLRYDEAIERFKAEYDRQYADAAEEALRKNLLMQHVRFTSAGNREGATFELGVNFLGDRLDAELAELLGVRAEPERELAERFPHSRAELRAAEPALPERFDWRPRGAVSPVRYQGSCASCWAFAVAGAVEGALFVRSGRLTPLSEKCLVDCAHPFGANGCRGTWPSHAYDYVQARGLPALDDYPPYEDKVGSCAAASARPVTRISAHVNVTANSVPALKVAIRKHAPTVVIIDAKAKSFVFYKKGVLYDDRCGKAGRRLNHAVLAVGWGARRGEPHFVLKNSWSEAWGERGYVRLQARANTCGVLAKPSYPRLERADVLRGPS